MAKDLGQPKDSGEHLERLQALLSDFSIQLGRPDLRERVIALIPSFDAIRKLGVSLMPDHVHEGARERILAYFHRYPQLVLDGDELMVVSGIGEWARRVRELRVEDGWLINSGMTYRELALDLKDDKAADMVEQLGKELGFDPLSMRPDQYILASEEQDRDAAYRWRQLNRIRKSSGSVRDKVLAFLISNVGRPVSGEELRYLSPRSTEWARRVRELRTEFGWAVASRMSGRPDLPVGVYVLEHDRQARLNDRKINDAVRVNVLNRDRHRCRVCSWDYSQRSPGDPRQYLELHHLLHHAKGGKNVEDNLITLCNTHHDEVHSSPEAELRVQSIMSDIRAGVVE